MFKPVSNSSKLFMHYLRKGDHAAKIRIQNLWTKYFFRRGIKLVNEDGVTFKLMPNDWITRTILTHGEYEVESLRLSKKLLMNGGVFIDIGANFGLYSCMISENRKVQVYAVEPNYLVVPTLLDNVSLNKRENVKVLNVALSDNFQFVSFNLPDLNNLGTASFEVVRDAPFSVMSCSLEFIFKSPVIG